jgi:hypothetical protein
MCETLERILAMRIPNLIRTESEKWCGLDQFVRSEYAYINYCKRPRRIEIEYRGNPEKLQSHTKLVVQTRQLTTGGFSDRYEARVFVDSATYLEEVASMLFLVSFPSS